MASPGDEKSEHKATNLQDSVNQFPEDVDLRAWRQSSLNPQYSSMMRNFSDTVSIPFRTRF